MAPLRKRLPVNIGPSIWNSGPKLAGATYTKALVLKKKLLQRCGDAEFSEDYNISLRCACLPAGRFFVFLRVLCGLLIPDIEYCKLYSKPYCF